MGSFISESPLINRSKLGSLRFRNCRLVISLLASSRYRQGLEILPRNALTRTFNEQVQKLLIVWVGSYPRLD